MCICIIGVGRVASMFSSTSFSSSKLLQFGSSFRMPDGEEASPKPSSASGRLWRTNRSTSSKSQFNRLESYCAAEHLLDGVKRVHELAQFNNAAVLKSQELYKHELNDAPCGALRRSCLDDPASSASTTIKMGL